MSIVNTMRKGIQGIFLFLPLEIVDQKKFLPLQPVLAEIWKPNQK